MNTSFKAYFIQCITNLHVGSGDANYGIVDKLVQRDPITNYPTIHASSLKGGLRQHFEEKYTGDGKWDHVFGTKTQGEDTNSGNYKFLNADLVAIPVRCTHNQFAYGFDKKSRDMVNEKTSLICGKPIFKLNELDFTNKFYGGIDDAYAEDTLLKKKDFITPFTLTAHNPLKEQFITFDSQNFAKLIDNLPVIARNRLDEDRNLWYEEIVPHHALFITFIGTSVEDGDFSKAITDDIIQIGANASVGYGLCKFTEIKF